MSGDQRIDFALVRAEGGAAETLVERRLERAQRCAVDDNAGDAIGAFEAGLLFEPNQIGLILGEHEAARQLDFKIAAEVAFEFAP